MMSHFLTGDSLNSVINSYAAMDKMYSPPCVEMCPQDQPLCSWNVSPLSYTHFYNNLNVLLAVQAMQELGCQPQYLVSLKDIPKVEKASHKVAVQVEEPKNVLPVTEPEKKPKVYKFKRRTKSEKKSWTREEIILLLQAAKLLLHRDLKTITKAIYACIDRKPGKCWGRGAEKKLKRILCFQNWRTADKTQISRVLNKRLKEYNAERISPDSQIYKVAKALTFK